MSNATSIARKTPAVTLKPVSRRSIADDALGNLRKAIITGAYAPGDHLAEAALAKMLEANIARTAAATHLLEVTLLDVAFHDLIMGAAQHSRLYACWNTLRHQLEYWLSRMHRSAASSGQHTREETADCHRRLVKVLRSEDEQKAGLAMIDHIESWRRQLAYGEGAAG